MGAHQTSDFAVIFDMDGVIVDSNPVHRSALIQFLDQHNITLTEQDLRKKVFGRTNNEWLQEVFPGITEENLHQYIQEKEALYRDLYDDTIKPLPGLREFLTSLQSHRVPMAVATSAPKINADWVMERTSLSGYFDTVLTAKDVEQGKPHPEIYLKTAAAIDLDPSQCVVFEDSLSGVESAKRAGSIVVGVSTTHSAEEMENTDRVVPDFTGLNYQAMSLLVRQKQNSIRPEIP